MARGREARGWKGRAARPGRCLARVPWRSQRGVPARTDRRGGSSCLSFLVCKRGCIAAPAPQVREKVGCVNTRRGRYSQMTSTCLLSREGLSRCFPGGEGSPERGRVHTHIRLWGAGEAPAGRPEAKGAGEGRLPTPAHPESSGKTPVRRGRLRTRRRGVGGTRLDRPEEKGRSSPASLGKAPRGVSRTPRRDASQGRLEAVRPLGVPSGSPALTSHLTAPRHLNVTEPRARLTPRRRQSGLFPAAAAQTKQ